MDSIWKIEGALDLWTAINRTVKQSFLLTPGTLQVPASSGQKRVQLAAAPCGWRAACARAIPTPCSGSALAALMWLSFGTRQ